MTWKTSMIAAALSAGLALASATAASAVTVNLGASNLNQFGGPQFYTANFDFILPANFINASLTVSELSADDRGVLRLNGADIDSAGIFGDAHFGAFDFNNGFGSVGHYFENNGLRNVVVTTGFLSGANSLRLLVNDTGSGIFGGLNGSAQQTGYSFSGQLNYDLRTGGAVPEPATWAMMILGFGAAGAMLRRRRLCAA